jgi:MFS family permease
MFMNPKPILWPDSKLLFIPTMIRYDWGVRHLQEAHGRSMVGSTAPAAVPSVGSAAAVGLISDRIGRQTVTTSALARLRVWPGSSTEDGDFPPYPVGIVAGIASGAAMLPYTVIKEANPPQFGGTATGVINFLNFTFSALLGPVFSWILYSVSGGSSQMKLEHYQSTFVSLLYGVAIAVMLTLLLKETGPAARTISPAARQGG